MNSTPLLLSLIGSAALMTPGTLQSATTWRTPTLNFEFASEQDGMGLISLKHRNRSTEFISRQALGAQALFWKIELAASPEQAAHPLTITNRTPAESREAIVSDHAITLRWKRIPLPNDTGLIDVTIIGQVDKSDGSTRWRIQVENESRKLGIWRVIFPAIELGELTPDGENDYLLCAPAEGRSVRSPIGRARGRFETRHDRELTTDNQEMVVNHQDYGFGASRPNGLPYPSDRGQMQLSAYYIKEGNDTYHASAAKGTGLYFSAHDGENHPKIFFYTPDFERRTLSFEIAAFPDQGLRPSTAYSQPYDTVLQAFEGDWYDATRIYRQWALEQSWCKPGPLATRQDIPDWLRHTVGVLRGDTGKSPNRNILKETTAFREHLPGHWLLQWYCWSETEKEIALSNAYAFPPVANADDNALFRQTLKQLREERITTAPYFNTRLWDSAAKDAAQAEPHTILLANGKRYISNETKLRKVMGICVQSPFWHKYVSDISSLAAERFDLQALYLDQAGGALFGGSHAWNGCFDLTHNHPPGVTQHLIHAEHERLAHLLKEVQRHQPRAVLVGEGVSESFIDVTPARLAHFEIWPGFVPLFSAVYHDYATTFGRTISLNTKDEADPLPRIQMAWQFIIGYQLGRLWSSNFSPAPYHEERLKRPVTQENLGYLRRLSELRMNYPDYLTMGSMERPPHLPKAPAEVVTRAFPRFPTTTLPGVLASTWRSPKGKLATAVTRISDEAGEVTLELDADELGLKPDTTAHLDNGIPVPLTFSQGKIRTTLPLAPLQAHLILWNP